MNNPNAAPLPERPDPTKFTNDFFKMVRHVYGHNVPPYDAVFTLFYNHTAVPAALIAPVAGDEEVAPKWFPILNGGYQVPWALNALKAARGDTVIRPTTPASSSECTCGKCPKA